MKCGNFVFLTIIPVVAPIIEMPNINRGDSIAGRWNEIGSPSNKPPMYGKIISDTEPIITAIKTPAIKAGIIFFL